MDQNARHNQLFMLELILSIFFFLICTTVCIQLFMKAHLLSQKTDQTNQAIYISQNLAEKFLSAPQKSATSILLFFDKEGAAIDTKELATYYAYTCSHIENSFSYETIYIGMIEKLPEKSDDKLDLALTQTLTTQAFHQLSLQKYIGGDA